MKLQVLGVRAAEELDAAFAPSSRSARMRCSSWRTGYSCTTVHPLMSFAAAQRLPSVNAYRELVEVGGLISYGPSYEDMHRRAATYVDRILKGANAGDLPIEQPTKFTLIINLKAAKALGLDMPATLIARADEVIE